MCQLQAFLLFGNLDQSTWTKTLTDSRSAYTSLKEHFLKTIEDSTDAPVTDPLADDEKVRRPPASHCLASEKPSDLRLSH